MADKQLIKKKFFVTSIVIIFLLFMTSSAVAQLSGIFYEEHFSYNLPDGWEVINNLSENGCIWGISNFQTDSMHNINDYYAYVNPMENSECNNADTTIISAPVDCTNMHYIQLTFESILYSYITENETEIATATVLIYNDYDGWIEIEKLLRVDIENSEDFNVSYYADNRQNVRIAWSFKNLVENQGFWYIDNVLLWEWPPDNDDDDDDDEDNDVDDLVEDDDETEKSCGC